MTFGRKRRILMDALGLILLAHIHAASLNDTADDRVDTQGSLVSAGTGPGGWPIPDHSQIGWRRSVAGV
jgi:hypothetical protein